MSWCPQCDEVFPQGPTCPRCRSPLVETDDGRVPEVAGGNLPQLKVPRRVRRAFDRMGREPAPPRQLMALGMACILFAGGFLVGRMGAVMPDQPALPELRAAPLSVVGGSVQYVARPPGPPDEPALVRHDVQSGEIDTVGRFSLPIGGPLASRVRTSVVARGESVAVLLNGAVARGHVGAFTAERPFPLWLEGVAAGWESPSTLLVLGTDGGLRRWQVTMSPTSHAAPGAWTGLHPTPAGVVLEGEREGRTFLAVPDGGRFAERLTLPPRARVLAVAPGAAHALLERDGDAVLWDGTTERPLQAEGYRAVAASYSRDGARLAVSLVPQTAEGSGSVFLGITDRSGRVGFHEVTAWPDDEACSAVPAWDPGGRWVMLAPGNGHLFLVEASGGTVKGLRAGILGCGLVWTR